MNRSLWAADAIEARLRDTRLRTLLRINALFSAATGIVATLAPRHVDGALDIGETWIVRAIGLALLLYAVDLLVVAALRHSRLVPLGRVAAGADAAWVLATGTVVTTGVVSSGGAAFLGLLAVPVGTLAISQWRAAAATDSAADEVPPIEALRIELVSRADPVALWAAISDHALFGRLAANLRSVEVVSGEGEGMVRRCVARGGKDWTETCTVWDAGHRHAVEIDPARYPFPLALVGCLSYVEPDPAGGHRVGALFQLQAKPGLAGHLMLLAMHLGRPILHRIVRGWDRAAQQRPTTLAAS